MLSLTSDQLEQGLVTCSTGNHALAFLYACSAVPAANSATSRVYLPENASPAKVCDASLTSAYMPQWAYTSEKYGCAFSHASHRCSTECCMTTGLPSRLAEHITVLYPLHVCAPPNLVYVEQLQVSKLEAQGAHVVQFGSDCVLAEMEARRVAEQEGITYISPYNDWEVRPQERLSCSTTRQHTLQWACTCSCTSCGTRCRFNTPG